MKLETPYTFGSRANVWLVIFIFLSIFINSIVLFNNPFEFYLGYLIYILLLPIFISRYKLSGGLVPIFLILLLTGIFNILIGNDTFALFFKVFTGLTLSYFFYYYVIIEFDYNISQLFMWYMRGAYLAALIGLIQFLSFIIGFQPGYDFSLLLNKWAVIKGGNFGIRINSIFAEPTYLASVLSAAFFISIYNIMRKETVFISRNQSFVIIIVYILSFSGLGQGGIFLTFIFLAINYGFFRYVIVLVPAGIILFNSLYNNVADFRDRYDGLIGLFSGEEFKLGKTHGSSFILYNNFTVTLENFKHNFVFGGGIGSHPVAFDKYSLARNFKVYGFNNNSADANSMFLRLLSETGLFGVSIFLFIIFKCYVRRNENHNTYHWLVSNSILVMILLNLFRQGHYFLNGFPFFMLLYYFNSLSYNHYLQTGKTLYESTHDHGPGEEPETLKLN